MSVLTDSNSNRSFVILAFLVTIAIIVGGGGVRYGLANLFVQLAALAALAFHRVQFADFWRKSPRALVLLIGLTIALPVAQLMPIPHLAVTALPGRETLLEARSMAQGAEWFAFSVDPARTLVALSGLILPLTVLVITRSLAVQRLIWIGWLVVGLGIASFLFGTIQVVSAGETGLLYPENSMPGVLFGTFANRNTAGLFFVSALSLAALLPFPDHSRSILIPRFIVCALLVLAIVLTRSRSAIVLMAIPIGLSAMKLFWEHKLHSEQSLKFMALALAAGVLAVLGAISATAGTDSRLAQSFERFEAREDARSEIWDDAVYSAQRYWPMGAGMGTFDEIFQLDESLENLAPRRAGRAHNDYLEIAIEAGLPGIALVVGWLFFVIWLSWRARRSPMRWSAWAGAATLAAIALQSAIDYPLRSQAFLGLGAFALILLAQMSKPPNESAP